MESDLPDPEITRSAQLLIGSAAGEVLDLLLWEAQLQLRPDKILGNRAFFLHDTRRCEQITDKLSGTLYRIVGNLESLAIVKIPYTLDEELLELRQDVVARIIR